MTKNDSLSVMKNVCLSVTKSDHVRESKIMNKITKKKNVTHSELSARGTIRDVENTPKFTPPNCILARPSSLGPPPVGRIGPSGPKLQ